MLNFISEHWPTILVVWAVAIVVIVACNHYRSIASGNHEDPYRDYGQ